MNAKASLLAFAAAATLAGCGGGGDGGADTTPPVLVSYSPAADAKAIDHGRAVDVFFNEDINRASIHGGSFALRDSGNALVAGTYEFLDDGFFFRVRFVPAAPLGGGRVYHVAITTAISDLAGNALAAPFSWSFTTAPSGTGSWAPTSTTSAPSARAFHTAVWTGSEMLVWGGPFSDAKGYRYDPASDTWTAMSTTNAPTPRWSHSAVWTGSEMIVWGGRVVGSAYTWFNDGARYDPATDTWQAIAASGAPEARAEHTAVWTGTEMLIWGGRNGSFFAAYPQAGGRYDPATDTWQAMTTTGAPAGRTGHAAVWGGSELIVWGGRNSVTSNFTYLATGGRYDPAMNTWLPISAVDAPSARALLSGVWTGSEMIVWGGFDGAQYLDSGARYDPLAGWQPTAQDNALLPREGHSAVWTGSRMILWGGYTADLSSELRPRLGGIYDPASNTWGYTTTLNAPSGRQSHSALWTGSHMLIWGGLTGTAINSGGKYLP